MQRFQQALISPEYILEPKIDGCHYVGIEGRLFGPRISDVTGWPVEKTDRMPHISRALQYLPEGVIPDGEVYLPGRKAQHVITITGCLPAAAIAAQQRLGWKLHYMIFDILRTAQGEWMLNWPWKERRLYLQTLRKTLLEASDGLVEVIPIYQNNKPDRLREIIESGREGIVLKKKTGIYVPGQRPMWNWIKYKQETEDDVIILGFEPPERLYAGSDPNWPYEDGGDRVTKYWYWGWVGSIVVGKYDDRGVLTKVGTVSGMDDYTRQDMAKNPAKYLGKVIKIRAMEITQDGAYRHPSFDMLRPDKNPSECRIKEV